MNKSRQGLMPKLIFLAIITTSIVTTLSFSKYKTTVLSTNTARVSKPVLNVEFAENQKKSQKIDCNTENTTVNYNIIVSNTDTYSTTDVSLKYDVIITLPTEITEGLSVDIDGKSATKDKNTYTVKSLGKFTPNEKIENTHSLTFKANSEVIRSCNLKDAKIIVYAEQID